MRHKSWIVKDLLHVTTEYLEKKGIDRKRIVVDGKGETSPLAINKNPDGSDSPLGRYLNRQVYVKIAGSVPASSELAGIYVPEKLKKSEESRQALAATDFTYTIQVGAAHTPLSISRLEELGELTEYHCTDGYYRYVIGLYPTFQKATEQLRLVRKLGVEDAFIQTMQWYERAMK